MKGKFFSRFWGNPSVGVWSALELDHRARYYIFTADYKSFGISIELDLNSSRLGVGFMLYRWGLKLKVLLLEVTLNWLTS